MKYTRLLLSRIFFENSDKVPFTINLNRRLSCLACDVDSTIVCVTRVIANLLPNSLVEPAAAPCQVFINKNILVGWDPSENVFSIHHSIFEVMAHKFYIDRARTISSLAVPMRSTNVFKCYILQTNCMEHL